MVKLTLRRRSRIIWLAPYAVMPVTTSVIVNGTWPTCVRYLENAAPYFHQKNIIFDILAYLHKHWCIHSSKGSNNKTCYFNYSFDCLSQSRPFIVSWKRWENEITSILPNKTHSSGSLFNTACEINFDDSLTIQLEA